MPHPAHKSVSGVLELVAATLNHCYGESTALCYGADGNATELPASQELFLAQLESSIRNRITDTANVSISGRSLSDLAASLQSACAQVSWSGSAGDLKADKIQDVIVIEGSIHYLEQLALFSNIRRILVDQGSLFLFGENLNDDSLIKRSELANLSSLFQLSERLGFELVRQEDFTPGALRSVSLLLELAVENREQIVEALSGDIESFESAAAQLETIADEFISDRRCFRLFEFRKIAEPPGDFAHVEYGDISSFDPSEVMGLFESSFGATFDAELWAWKYQLGQGTCVVGREPGSAAIVSHYGGAPRKIDYFGKPQMAIQPCDVMVSPDVRRHYGKSSLFFKTAATFLEREIGNTVGQLLGYGFPNQKAMNIALRLGLYEKTDDFVEVVYAADASAKVSYNVENADVENASHCRIMDRLWESMRPGLSAGIAGVRDADYLKYRYFDHPFGRRGLLTRLFLRDEDSGEILCFAVLKDHEGQRLLMDVVCPLTRMERNLELLCHHVQQHGNSLKLWITEGWLHKVQRAGCTVNALGIEIPCNSWNPGPDSGVLYGAWWLTAGDMDFI